MFRCRRKREVPLDTPFPVGYNTAMLEIIIKPLIISLTFLAGFFLLDAVVINKIKQKKIYCWFIETVYFLCYWSVVYAWFL
jgi:hypothetical protein